VSGVPDDRYNSLDHVYMRNLPETCDILGPREVARTADAKMFLTDADFAMYYKSESNVSFNSYSRTEWQAQRSANERDFVDDTVVE